MAVAATSCVYRTVHSGKIIVMVIDRIVEQFTEYNMCSIQPRLVITYSPKSIMTEIHYMPTQRHVQFAMRQVDQQFSIFQQEHNVRTAGPWSTQDISSQIAIMYLINEATTSAWTKRRKSQLVEQYKTKHWSTLLKSSVDHCHVQSTPMEESWTASFAPNDLIYWHDWWKLNIPIISIVIVLVITCSYLDTFTHLDLINIWNSFASCVITAGTVYAY